MEVVVNSENVLLVHASACVHQDMKHAASLD